MNENEHKKNKEFLEKKIIFEFQRKKNRCMLVEFLEQLQISAFLIT